MSGVGPQSALPAAIGAYRIDGALGRGGMGEVLLAWDERLERHVAIKRIRTDKPIDSRRRARFRREARAIARLSHPAIVQVFDLVTTDDGECIVMEYVDGRGLDVVLASGRLALGFALQLGAEIADGLAQAHAKGLIHRDLKAQNVRVTPSGHVKLLDFGLARMLEAAPTTPGQPEDPLTESGALVGTASAMSPEQARGGAVDPRSDLFALGSLLHQLLTGEAPFAGPNLLETLHRVTTLRPRPVNELRPDASPELTALVSSLLEKEPALRPQSAQLVRVALERMVRQGVASTAAVPPPPAVAPLLPVPASTPTPAVDVDLANLSTGAPLLQRAEAAQAAGPAPARPGTGVVPGAGLSSLGSLPVLRVLARLSTDGTEETLAIADAAARTGGTVAAVPGPHRLWTFERPTDAVAFALAVHAAHPPRSVRVALHLGELVLTGSPLQATGAPVDACARILALALPGQTLLSREVFDLARRPEHTGALADPKIRWLAHGPYAVRGLERPVELFEVGLDGAAALQAPPDAEPGKRIVSPQDEATLGWRPAAGQAIPQRPNWILRERLGQGGFGEVWLATHPSGEQRVFKFCFEAERLRALKREITLVRLLESALGQRPDIARVLDWDVSAAPYFLESEYTDGGDLVDWSDEQGGIAEVPLTTRLELVAEVAGALAAAHSVGVLHKDVKPQNVLITRDRDGRPRARLADFGIGLVLDREALGAPGLSALGFTGTLAGTAESAGTLGYLAPEVLEGKPATVQADLYALGVMLYQLVAGDFTRTLAPGWQRDIADDLLAQDIAALVDRAPERRPASAAEVAERLRTLEKRREERAQAERLQREALQAREALQRAQGRRRVAAGIAGLASLMLVGVSGFAYQAWRARQTAELRRAQAEGLIDFMLGDLRGKLQPLGKLAILDDVGKRALDYFAAVPEAELSEQELQARAKALDQIGQVRIAQGALADATVALREALRSSQDLATRDPQNAERQFNLGQSHFWVGFLLWRQRELTGAAEQFRAYLHISEALVARDPRNRAWMLELAYAHSNLGSVARETGDDASAQAAFRAAAGIMETLLALSPDDDALRLELGHVHAKLGDLLVEGGDLTGATAWFEKYRSTLQLLVERAPGDMERLRYLGYAHSHLGDVLRQRGDLDGAWSHYRDDLAIAEKLAAHDADNPGLSLELALRQDKVAGVEVLRGRLDEAAVLYAAARTRIDALLAQSPEHRDWRFARARNRWSSAQLLILQGQPVKATVEVREAIALLDALTAAAPEDRSYAPWRTYCGWLLGQARLRAGAGAEAREVWESTLATATPPGGPRADLFTKDLRARLLLSLGRTEEATPLLQALARAGYRDATLLELCREHGVALAATP